MINLIAVRTDAEYDAAIGLFKEYAAQLGVDLCFQSFDQELLNIRQKYGPPTGELWLLQDGAQYVGCAGLWQLAEDTCEIKRMYVREAYRGQHLGEKLLQTALDLAPSLGYQKIKLDTLARLKPAVSLYQKYGFTQTFPYNYNPESDVMYFEKPLV